jgi:hypothetical protein
MLAACPPAEPPTVPIPPVSAGKVHVRVFTAPAPTTAIAALGEDVFVGTRDGLEHWAAGGHVETVGAEQGLPGTEVVALAAEPERHRIWILTDAALATFDVATNTVKPVDPPPITLGVDYASLARDGGVSLAAAHEGGVWLGTPAGLLFVTDRGGWATTPITDPVRAIVRDPDGWLWIAARHALWAKKPTGELVRIGAAQGCEVSDPQLVALAPRGGVLVVGTGDEGHERLAIGRELAWSSFRTLPELAIDAVTPRSDAVIARAGGTLYRIAPTAPGTIQPLARDGVQLVPQAGGPSAWSIDPLALALPPDPTTLASAGDVLLVGTRDRGVARYRIGDAHPHDWLRRGDMFADAASLTVACTRPEDCWIATGAHQAWHWTGDRFVAGGPDEVVLAVVRQPDGAILAVHRTADERVLHVARLDSGSWVDLPSIALVTPGDAPEISFARFAPGGALWLGLRYHDAGERRAYGVAVVDLATGKVAYHRTESAPDSADAAMLPIPVDTVDAAMRGDAVWFATSEGVARLLGGKVTVWTEADGLISELARAVTIAPELGVIVATGAGAEVWNGKAWAFPPALRFDINDLVATRSGQVWMATERGIAAWDGAKVRRVDVRRGLAENEILEVAVDRFDRVWARGRESLTLISQ